MKKYFLTMVVMAIFAIGFAASDDSSSSSDPQEQESPADKQQEVKEKAYNAGYEDGFTFGPEKSFDFDFLKMRARGHYSGYYGAPMSDEEKVLYDLFVEHYTKGYREGARNR